MPHLHDDDPDTIYTPEQAAPILHPDLSARTMERWRRTGRGPAFVRIGRRVGYTAQSLRQFIGRQTRQHTGEDGE